MIPSLIKLLSQKTVLVLGAGASKDYGFPLWSELREDLLRLFKDDEYPEISQSSCTDWWIETLENMSVSDTIDTIAAETEGEHFDVFRKATSIVICGYEAKDKGNGTKGWIEELAARYLNIFENFYKENDADSIKQYSANLSVITLNYDRVFDVRFHDLVKDPFCKLLQAPREYEKRFRDIFNGVKYTYHPHGCIGGLSGHKVESRIYLQEGGGYILDYGDLDKLRNYWFDKYIPFLAPVDDLKDANNPTYSRANDLLKSAEHCICLGLSPLGLEKSFLDFSGFRQVYYNGKEQVFPNFVPLSIEKAHDVIKLL